MDIKDLLDQYTAAWLNYGAAYHAKLNLADRMDERVKKYRSTITRLVTKAVKGSSWVADEVKVGVVIDHSTRPVQAQISVVIRLSRMSKGSRSTIEYSTDYKGAAATVAEINTIVALLK